MHFGPQEILLNLDIRFREDLSVAQVTEAIDRIDRTSVTFGTQGVDLPTDWQ